MEYLEKNWLTADPIDFEYKKYKLLSYDQMQRNLHKRKLLYPNYTDVIENINYLTKFLIKLKSFEESKQEITDIDFVNQKLNYESMLSSNELDEIKDIAEYGKEILTNLFDLFSEMYNDVESNIACTGYKLNVFEEKNGFVVLKKDKKDYYYEYNVADIYLNNDHCYTLNLEKIDEKKYFNDRLSKNIFDIYVNDNDYPFNETVFPIVKRTFLRHLFLDKL